MKYHKIIPGWVVQVFDEEGVCLSQHFAYDKSVRPTIFTNQNGDHLNEEDLPFKPNMHFEMQQPPSLKGP